MGDVNENTQWLNDYLAGGFDKVGGWVDKGVFAYVVMMDRVLQARNVQGGICEIGVHHGRFFIPLNSLCTSEAAISVALDVFEDQNLNIDKSGSGDRQLFENNLQIYDKFRGRNVRTLTGDSTVTKPETLLNAAGHSFKIVSIDGGHTAEHTISDLELAASIVTPGGFVMVDDILNRHWLGVMDGVTTYLRRRPTLWPLAIGFNKLIFCNMSVHQAYSSAFTQMYKFQKTTHLCGYPILSH